MAEHFHDPHRDPFGIPRLGTFPSEFLQVIDRSHPFGGPFGGVFVAKAIELKVDAISDFDGVGYRLGGLSIKQRDLLDGPQGSLGVDRTKARDLVDRRPGRDGLEAVVEDHALRVVVERTAGGYQWNAALSAELTEPLEFPSVVGFQV